MLSGSQANALAKKHLGTTDGNYFIRRRPNPANPKAKEYILTVIYKGAPTQHMVIDDGAKNLTINKKPSSCSNIKVRQLRHF